MTKYVLFDFDGTLIDSNEAIVTSLNHVAYEFRGEPFNNLELNAILGQPIINQMQLLSTDETDRLVEMYRIEYRRVRDELTQIYDDVVSLLLTLKEKKIKVGVVSNKGRSGINHGISLFKLDDLIDVTISLNDVENPKPHEEGIYKALLGLGVSEIELPKALTQTIFVGDSGHDIETAKNAGCRSVLVGWTIIDMNQLVNLNPDFIIQTPLDLLQLL